MSELANLTRHTSALTAEKRQKKEKSPVAVPGFSLIEGLLEEGV